MSYGPPEDITMKVTGICLIPATTTQWQEFSWYHFVLGLAWAGVHRPALWKAGKEEIHSTPHVMEREKLFMPITTSQNTSTTFHIKKQQFVETC